MDPNNRQFWLLVIIDSSGHVDGSTRLQKYGLLASQITLKDEPTYNDWKPYHYGAFSSQLDSDVKFLKGQGLVDVRTTTDNYEQQLYCVSSQGKSVLGAFKAKYDILVQKIKILADYYSDKSLDDLLADAYSLFPQYTTNSKISARVRHTILKRDTRLNSQFVLPYTDRTIGLSSITATAQVNPFPYDDEDARRKLARQIGLADVPPIDSKVFDEIPDIFTDQKPLSESDLEEIIEGSEE